MVSRSVDRGCPRVGEHNRRRRRVDARIDEMEPYFLTVGRTGRGRTGLLCPSVIVVDRRPWIAKDIPAQGLTAEWPAFERAVIVALHSAVRAGGRAG